MGLHEFALVSGICELCRFNKKSVTVDNEESESPESNKTFGPDGMWDGKIGMAVAVVHVGENPGIKMDYQNLQYLVHHK